MGRMGMLMSGTMMLGDGMKMAWGYFRVVSRGGRIRGGRGRGGGNGDGSQCCACCTISAADLVGWELIFFWEV
jgi:hypothetical protein